MRERYFRMYESIEYKRCFYRGYNTPLVISYPGKIAIETERKARKQHNFNEFRAWGTLVIAVIALIISIVALQC